LDTAEKVRQDSGLGMGLVKFLILTSLGIIMFTVKVGGTQDSVLLYLIHFFQRQLKPVLLPVLLVYMALALAGNILGCLFHLKFITKRPFLRKYFDAGYLQLITLLLTLVIVCCAMFLPGAVALNSHSADLLDMSGDIFVFLLIARTFLPIISDYGLSELLEVYLSPLIKPVLKVPGAAFINILTSMFVSVTVSVVLTAEQFRNKIFNKKEALIVLTSMMVPSMPLSMLVYGRVGLDSAWSGGYLHLLVTCLIVAVIAIRLWPIRSKPEEFLDGSSRLAEEQGGAFIEPKHVVAMRRISGKARDTKFNPANCFVQMLFNMISFLPYVIAWGTLINLVLSYTPIVQYLTYPYGLYLRLLGIEQGIAVAPVTVLSFIDVVMPTVVLKDIADPSVVIKMLTMTLGQMIYVAPLMLTLAIEGLTSLRELLGVLLVRILLLAPIAVLLYGVFF